MNLLLLRSVAKFPWSRMIAMHVKWDTAGEAADTVPSYIYRRSTSWRRLVMVLSLHEPSDAEFEIFFVTLGIIIQERWGLAQINVKQCDSSG